MLVFVLNVKINVGVVVVDDPYGIELATFTAYVLLGPLEEPIDSIISIRIREWQSIVRSYFEHRWWPRRQRQMLDSREIGQRQVHSHRRLSGIDSSSWTTCSEQCRTRRPYSDWGRGP